MRRIYIYFLPNEVILFGVNGNQLNKESSFSNDLEGQNHFSSWVSEHRESIFYVIIDGLKESFHIEHIPFVGFGDRFEILERRLGHFYKEGVFKYIRPAVGWLNGVRHSRIPYVLSTIPESGIVNEWLDKIENFRCPLAGIYSSSSLMNNYVKSLGSFRDEPTTVLVPCNDGMVKHFLFLNKRIVFYRISSEPKNKWDRETIKIQMQRDIHYFYLSFNLDPGKICFFALELDREDYRSGVFKSLVSENFKCMSANDFFQGLKTQGYHANIDAKAVGFLGFMVYLLDRFHYSNHYAPMHRLYYKSVFEISILLKRLSVLFLALCVCFSIIFGVIFLGKYKEKQRELILKEDRGNSIASMSHQLYLGGSKPDRLNKLSLLYKAIANRPRFREDFEWIVKAFLLVNKKNTIDFLEWSIDAGEPSAEGVYVITIHLKGSFDLLAFNGLESVFYEAVQQEISKKIKVEKIENLIGAGERKIIYLKKESAPSKKEFDMRISYKRSYING
jgi:hypothetical protein